LVLLQLVTHWGDRVLWAAAEPHSAFTVQKIMKSAKPSDSAASGIPGAEPNAPKDEAKSANLDVTERRHFIRPLPVPDAVESDGDTDWATFQALNTEQPKD
jgi:hypothetical protein